VHGHVSTTYRSLSVHGLRIENLSSNLFRKGRKRKEKRTRKRKRKVRERKKEEEQIEKGGKKAALLTAK